MSDRVFSVTASALRLRRAPSLSSEVIASLPRGQLVARLDLTPRGPWFRVFADTPGEGAYVGYADARWLRVWSQAPVASPPATPPTSPPPPAASSPPASPPVPPRATVPPAPAPQPASTAPATTALYGMPITLEGFNEQAARLGIGFEEFWAVIEVESAGEGFFAGGDIDRLPKILYERHIFSEKTNGRFDRSHPGLSNPVGYTRESGAAPDDSYGGPSRQYPRLVAAAALDRTAALKSVSWGLGQVMGFNHAVVGYPDVEAMVADMRRSEDLQLKAFVSFVISEGLRDKLQQHLWEDFAKKYNGPSYKRFEYHTRIEKRFLELKQRAKTPDILLRRAQAYLKFLGKLGLDDAADGLWGRKSRGAVEGYLVDKGVSFAPEQFSVKPDTNFLKDLIAEVEKDLARKPSRWPL